MYFCQEKEVSCDDTSEELSQLNSADITCKFCKDDMTPVNLALKVSSLTSHSTLSLFEEISREWARVFKTCGLRL